MFQGSVPPDLRSLILEHTNTWPEGVEVFVGCSGIFTIERILAPRFPVHGNDIQLLSCALGQWFAGDPIPITLKPEWEEKLGWLAPYLEDPKDAVATVMIGSRMLRGVHRENPYYARMMRGYRAQFEKLHAKTVATLDKSTLKLAGFYSGDVCDFVEQAGDRPVCCFPPFYAGDYEAQFKDLDLVFDWPRPEYPELDADRLEMLLDRIADREHWMVGNDHRRDQLEPFLRGTVQTSNRGVTIYVYSSTGADRIVVPRQKPEPVMAPRLIPGGTISGPLRVHPITLGQFQSLRSQYMNRDIVPGMPSVMYAVTAGDHLIGSFAWLLGSTPAQWDTYLPKPHAYLLSDFPVAPTSYKHLAKLVLTAALSEEVHRMVERYTSRRSRSVVTTAFADNPVSMKYRGLFDLLRRDENKPDDPHCYGKKFTLHYGRRWPGWTLQEGFDEWMKRRSQTR